MELVYVTVIGAAFGLLARYVLPGRRTYGILLLPAASAAATAVVWVALVWAGWKFDGGWIWVVSLAAAAITSILIPVLLPRSRDARDQQLLHKLSAGRA